MDLTKGDMVIFSGEGDNGTFERYYGARTPKAIRSRLSRERAHGDRWASAWISDGSIEDNGYPGVPVYIELDRDLDATTGRMRALTPETIKENPAARLAASKRGRSVASSRNGAAGGRPTAERSRIASELLRGCPDESREDHESIAKMLRRGDLATDILSSPECDRWPETYVWLKGELGGE